MPDKTATTNHPIHPMLASRWSTRAFSARLLDSDAIASMFEAARWSPSANNLQPWAFIYAERGTPDFEVLCGCLKETNVLWARNAALLGLAIERPTKPDGSPNAHASYDLGQAVAHMTFQACALGLHVHQMAGFDPAHASAALGIPPDLLPVTGFAIGISVTHPACPQSCRRRNMRPVAGTRLAPSSMPVAGRTMWIEKVLELIRLWTARYAQRNDLGEMEGHRLSDIGRSRSEVHRECKKWFWQK